MASSIIAADLTKSKAITYLWSNLVTTSVDNNEFDEFMLISNIRCFKIL
jgi:hypothetical protein